MQERCDVGRSFGGIEENGQIFRLAGMGWGSGWLIHGLRSGERTLTAGNHYHYLLAGE